VLFIGNSYTYVNQLPVLFERLAEAGGHAVETTMLAVPNSTLSDHLRWSETTATLRTRPWDIVVLQEQSLIPADPKTRREQMVPAATALAELARGAGARPALFMTWAHRRGWPEDGIVGYAAMQVAVDTGYEQVASQLHALKIPVGPAWAAVHRRHSRLALWQEDGSHPSLAGSYLAACVFYTTIFRHSATGLAYYAGLPPHLGLILQSTASEVALTYRPRTT
jgi:hypothetical protein